ncbi:MAG TPA: cadherin-like domain-containing protein, partial [Acidimicrobiales bacterium]
MTRRKLVDGSMKRRTFAAVVATSLVAGMVGLLAPAASAYVTAVTGSAYGFKGAISLFGGPFEPKGPTPQVTLPPDGSATPQTATASSLQLSYGPAVFFRSGPATVTTQGTPGPSGSVTSSTSFGPTAGNSNTPCPFSYVSSFTAGSPVVTSATANFTAGDLGLIVYSGFLPANNPHPNSEQKASIVSVDSPTQATMSVSATGSGSGYLTIDRGVGSCIYNSAFTMATASTTCTSNESGTTASTHFTNGLLVTETDDYQDPTVVVAIPDDPLPNTVIDGFFWLNGATKESFTYVLNEQVPNPDGSLTVNAAHLNPRGETAYGDTYFGSSTCGASSTDGPVAHGDTSSTIEDTPLSVAAPGVLANDTDPNGNALTAVKVSDPAHGSVLLNADGSYTYTPNANFNGSDSFLYKANNGTRDSNVASVNITVSAVNDAPTAANDSASTSQDRSITVAAPGVVGNDTDVDGDTLTVAKVAD